ncbi:MAG: carboxylesterase family protein, partial [Bradyrhizobium sp.]
MRLKSLVVAGLLLAGSGTAHAGSAGVSVKLDSGPISGQFQLNAEVRAFLGVPFAAPPVGVLRWKPPQPVASWQAPRTATSYGAQCMQGGRSRTSVYYEYAGDQPSSENCLFLN